MTDVVMYHHALGQTPGFLELAERWREAGHVVHTPDLYAGRVFDTLDEGVAHAESIGFEQVREAGIAAAADLPQRVVYVGFSLGVLSAQQLVSTRPGALGAVLAYGFVSPQWGAPWPSGLPAQVHGTESDPFFAGEGDLAAARAVSEADPAVELFVYPGAAHLFAEPAAPDFDAEAAALFEQRATEFLARF